MFMPDLNIVYDGNFNVPATNGTFSASFSVITVALITSLGLR